MVGQEAELQSRIITGMPIHYKRVFWNKRKPCLLSRPKSQISYKQPPLFIGGFQGLWHPGPWSDYVLAGLLHRCVGILASYICVVSFPHDCFS